LEVPVSRGDEAYIDAMSAATPETFEFLFL
jgi:hypothetical protein